MKHEGNYANVAGDRGGETYKGIARNIHRTWKGWALIDAWKRQHGEPRRNQYLPIAGLDELVQAFYKQYYWDKIYGDKFKSAELAMLIFDTYVHSGGTGVKLLQQAANQLGASLKVDGAFGPITFSTINNMSAGKVHDKLKQVRREFLQRLSQRPGQSQFERGWLARIDSFPDLEKKNSSLA